MHISINDSFDLQKIADSGQCFRVKVFDDQTFRFITGSHILYIRQISPGLYDVSCSLEEWNEVWHHYFDFDRSYSQLREAIPEDDPFLLKAYQEGVGIRILKQEHWETLITFIISQRKSIPAIKQSVELLCRTFGSPVSTPRETVYTFPSADRMKHISLEDLKPMKVGYRDKYIIDAIQKVAGQSMNLNELENDSDTDLFKALCSVKGVGPKVASCIGLFSYSRTSWAPVDTWIQKVIDTYYDGKNPFPAYESNAGIMQQYLFYYSIKHKEAFRAG